MAEAMGAAVAARFAIVQVLAKLRVKLFDAEAAVASTSLPLARRLVFLEDQGHEGWAPHV